MAIVFQDYFESYSLGPVVPSGFTLGANFGSNIVQAPPLIGIDGTKAWQLIGNAFRFEAPIASLTHFFAILGVGGQQQEIVGFFNGDPMPHAANQPILIIKQEPDASLTLRAGDGFLMRNSGKDGFSMYAFAWYTAQVNLLLSRETVGGIDYIKITLEVSVQGIPFGADPGSWYFSGSHTTNIPADGTYTGDANINNYQYNLAGYLIDSMTVETPIVPINTYPVPGVPVARVFQVPVEVMYLPNNAKARAFQAVLEVLTLPNNAKCRVMQCVIELMIAGAPRRVFWVPEYRRARRQW